MVKGPQYLVAFFDVFYELGRLAFGMNIGLYTDLFRCPTITCFCNKLSID